MTLVVGEDRGTLGPEEFVAAMNHFASGVAVVTSHASDHPVGATVAAIAPIAADPPTVMVSMATTSSTAGAVIARGSFAINVLDEDAAGVAGRFASRVPDKFEGLSWTADHLGNPLLPHRVASLSCRVLEAVASGSHWEIRAHAVEADAGGGNPLAYYRGSMAQLRTEADRAVTDALRDHVLSVRTTNGHLLDPDALAADLSTSRGTVLRALSRLRSESLVQRVDGRYSISALPEEAVDAAYAAKLVLEVGVAGQVIDTVAEEQLEGLREQLQRVEAASSRGSVRELVDALNAFGEHFVGLAGSEPLMRAYRALGLPGIDRRTVSEAMLHSIDAVGGLQQILDGLERRDLATVLDALRSELRTPAHVRRETKRRCP